jgi:hypothetical protein
VLLVKIGSDLDVYRSGIVLACATNKGLSLCVHVQAAARQQAVAESVSIIG